MPKLDEQVYFKTYLSVKIMDSSFTSLNRTSSITNLCSCEYIYWAIQLTFKFQHVLSYMCIFKSTSQQIYYNSYHNTKDLTTHLDT